MASELGQFRFYLVWVFFFCEVRSRVPSSLSLLSLISGGLLLSALMPTFPAPRVLVMSCRDSCAAAEIRVVYPSTFSNTYLTYYDITTTDGFVSVSGNKGTFPFGSLPVRWCIPAPCSMNLWGGVGCLL